MMTIPEEQWLPIPGHPFYEVSNQGRVRSIGRTVTRSNGRPYTYPGRMLNPGISSNGYPVVKLGKRCNRLVHRLVLMAFVGPCPPGHEGLHINGVKADPHLSNLRWGTSSENAFDAVRHGTHGCARRTHCPLGHLLVQPNLVPATASKGWRGCLACRKARGMIAYRRKKGRGFPALKDEADRTYRAIMGVAQTQTSPTWDPPTAPTTHTDTTPGA